MQDVNATGFCTWTSAIHLARRMLLDPEVYFPHTQSQLRVLELGSGTGLAGLAAVKALRLTAKMNAHVVLSDNDDSTLTNLKCNVAFNVPDLKIEMDSPDIELRNLSWNDPCSFPKGKFDVIIGADICYEQEHAGLIQDVVSVLLSDNGTFHLIIPLRLTHTEDVATLERLLSSDKQGERREKLLCIEASEEIEQGEEERFPHKYYRIGWKCT